MAAAGGVHGFVPALTSFVGRESEVGKAAGLLGGCPLVTVTGPGGVGKTRLAGQTGDQLRRLDCLDTCGHPCAARGQPADAITLWAAYAALNAHVGLPEVPQDAQRRQEPRRKAVQALGPTQTRAAEERGAAMTLATAVEFAALLIAPASPGPPPQPPPGLAQLSAREQELVILVARGHTDTQIAAQLYITVRTVRSHLDRIRDKTGSRRRADLTRLALQAGLL